MVREKLGTPGIKQQFELNKGITRHAQVKLNSLFPAKLTVDVLRVHGNRLQDWAAVHTCQHMFPHMPKILYHKTTKCCGQTEWLS